MRDTILCIDDDPTVLAALRSLLAKLGHDVWVEVADSGAEALEIARELQLEGTQQLAVVIADFLMPGMNGDEVLVQLHALCPNAIKIMLTGQSDFEGVKRAINFANLYRFMEKPFNNEDFLLTIQSAMAAFHYEHERRQHNLELTALNIELQQMIDTIAHQHENLARSEAKATLSTLIASVSHELSSPIGNGLLFATSFVDQSRKFQETLKSGQLKRSELGQFADTIEQGSHHLIKNMERAHTLLQNLKQVAADQASEQRRNFDLLETVQEILGTLGPSLRSKPHRIALDIPSGILMDSFPGALGQVIINLVNNAYLHAFTGMPGGVLQIGAAQDDSMLHIRFSDNGVGIAEENLVRLLEPFFSTRVGDGGTGLGMTIVDNLVRKTLGGTLEISSTPGQGSTFTVSIPAVLPVNATH
jgi:signal transduction histidine kinase